MRMDRVAARHHVDSDGNVKAASGKTTFAGAMRHASGRELPPNLHTTIKGQAWWVKKFEPFGWALNRTIVLPAWTCCGFILGRG